ncbi:MAG: hypothetical protein LBP87_15210 [Planctomycetaceae bacterium]|nr:hypothetical protein [Planctomycetaceae bacterium]
MLVFFQTTNNVDQTTGDVDQKTGVVLQKSGVVLQKIGAMSASTPLQSFGKRFACPLDFRL